MIMWSGVTKRFHTFHQNLSLTEAQIKEGINHHAGVRKSLNVHYYRSSSTSANSFLVGSWGKFTRTRPPRDIDLYFILPYEVYLRFELVRGNKQSALLQEVKRVLQATYPNTDLRGDGQVVIVGFNRINVEVVPAFALQNGQYRICDTRSGGQYKNADPKAEIDYISATNNNFNSNLRPLIMMMKAWQYHCNVSIKSFFIELVAADFLQQCLWSRKSYFYYDWIMRDFFAYLYYRANKYVIVPGTYETICLGDAWLSRVETAYNRAVKACDYERKDWINLAGEEWQKIFGTQIPKSV